MEPTKGVLPTDMASARAPQPPEMASTKDLQLIDRPEARHLTSLPPKILKNIAFQVRQSLWVLPKASSHLLTRYV